jgi:amidase
MNAPLWRLSAAQIASAVKKGHVSALEAVDAHLARIESVNPAVNAVTTVLADRARQAAQDIDRRRAAGLPLGAMAGVPITVKENIHVAGSATTFGIPRFRDLVPAQDAPTVARLRRAGAIPVGRTNLPDLTVGGLHTVSTLYGATRNPWDATRTPGGTSGGDAVAVATGMAALGLGNDSGGSLAVPAAFNAVAALKPGYGRFPMDHRLGGREPSLSSQLFPVDGPIARTIADLHTCFTVCAGTDPRDPRVVPAPLEGPRPGAPLRVAVVADPGGHGVHPDVRAGIDRAAAVLSDAGYAIEQDARIPSLDAAYDAYCRMIFTEFSLSWPEVRRLLTPQSRRHVEYSLAEYPPVSFGEYVELTGVRLRIQREWAEFAAEFPLLLGPVYTDLPPHPADMHATLADNVRTMSALRLCRARTFVGAPAVNLPVGVAHGLPQSVQLIGAMYREDQCLEAAAVIEARLGVLTPISPVVDGPARSSA